MMAAVLPLLLLLFPASCCGRVGELPPYIHNLQVQERRYSAWVHNQKWGPDPVPTPVLQLEDTWSLIPSGLVSQPPVCDTTDRERVNSEDCEKNSDDSRFPVVLYYMIGLFLGIIVAASFIVAVHRKIREYLRMRADKKKAEKESGQIGLNQLLPTTSSTSHNAHWEPARNGNETSTKGTVGRDRRQLELLRCMRRNKDSRNRRRHSNRRGGIFSTYSSSSMASVRSPVDIPESESVIARIWKTKPTAGGGGFLIGEEVDPEQIMPVDPRAEANATVPWVNFQINDSRNLQSSREEHTRVIRHTAQVHSADEIPPYYDYALRLPTRHVDRCTTRHATPLSSDQVVPSSLMHVARTSGRHEVLLTPDHVVPTSPRDIAS